MFDFGGKKRRLHKDVKQGKTTLPDGDLSTDMYEATIQVPNTHFAAIPPYVHYTLFKERERERERE